MEKQPDEKQFTLIPKLPVELRDKIWETSILTTPPHRILFMSTIISGPKPYRLLDFRIHHLKAEERPPIWRVNKEAYAEVLRHLPAWRERASERTSSRDPVYDTDIFAIDFQGWGSTKGGSGYIDKADFFAHAHVVATSLVKWRKRAKAFAKSQLIVEEGQDRVLNYEQLLLSCLSLQQCIVLDDAYARSQERGVSRYHALGRDGRKSGVIMESIWTR